MMTIPFRTPVIVTPIDALRVVLVHYYGLQVKLSSSSSVYFGAVFLG